MHVTHLQIKYLQRYKQSNTISCRLKGTLPRPPLPDRELENDPRRERERARCEDSLQDLVVLDALLQVLQVGVGAADRPHVRLQQLDVPLLKDISIEFREDASH